MPKTRRTRLEVAMDYLEELKTLEAERARLEPIAKDTSNPVHWAALLAIARIAAKIATIVAAIKGVKRAFTRTK